MKAWLRRLLNLPSPETHVNLYGPKGVRLRYTDGMIFEDVPSVYIGDDPKSGCAVYEILPPRDPEKDLPVEAFIGLLPGMTTVRFPFARSPRITRATGGDLRVGPDEP